MSLSPGTVRDSIIGFLTTLDTDASSKEIVAAVRNELGNVPASSVRSYLNLNTPDTFERTARGRYRLMVDCNCVAAQTKQQAKKPRGLKLGNAHVYNADCFKWIASQADNSIHAVVTDPPYGLLEYTPKETEKLRSGNGGVWRIPPSFDGHKRAPLPRFTVLNDTDKIELHEFFKKLSLLLRRVAVPGANIVIASNPLLAHIVSDAMTQSGLELRGYIVRQVMTMRGGDRPKNAHEEFNGVSVMPRSQWEPWVVLRNPLEGRVQDNLRKWKTGGFRRPSDDKPFGDLIRSSPTPTSERKIAPHPSLKPQAFMRQLVRASLPLGEGMILDPFMGAGSTLAAANAVGYDSKGIELDKHFYNMAKKAVPLLEKIKITESK